MDEATTTPEGRVDAGAPIVLEDDPKPEAQPTKTPAEPAAEAKADETHTDPEAGRPESTEAKAEAERRHEWLKNKGIDPTDPDALDKVEEKWREAEKQFHAGRQEAKQQTSVKDAINQDETAQALTDQMGENPEVVQLRRDVQELRFFTDNPEAKGHEEEIIATAKEYPMLAANFDLKTLWAVTKSKRLEETVKAAKSQGRTEAKAEIAKQSTAAAPAGVASGPTQTKSKDPFDVGFESE